MQMSLRQTAIMNISQTMNHFRHTHRTAVELREKILQLRRIRMQIGQVSTHIRIRYIRQTDCTHIAFQHRTAVITHSQIMECQRIERAIQGATKGDRTLQTFRAGNEQRYIGWNQLRFIKTQGKRDIVCGLAQIKRIHGRKFHFDAAHVQTRLGKTGF